MKKSIAIISLLFISIVSFCQTQVLIEDTLRPMSKGLVNGYSTIITKATIKDVEKDWTKYMMEGAKTKPVSSNGEINMVGAVVKNISTKPINIYSKLLETLEGVKLTAWFTENDSIFISKDSNSEQHLAVQKFVRDFVIRELKGAATKELNAEREKQKVFEKELAGFIKLEEKSNKKISENQRAIQRAKDNITSTNGDIQRKEEQIISQKGMVEKTAADPNANKGAKQTQKDLESGKKKLQNQNESQGKIIDRLEKEIREEQRNIEDMKKKEDLKKADIEKQKLMVLNAETKLNAIQ